MNKMKSTILAIVTFSIATSVQAGVGWIDNIYNNTPNTWYVKSIDDRHNGNISGNGTSQELDGGSWATIKSGHYSADWFGIPWYYQGKHYKVIKLHNKEVKFYTSEIGDKNWIIFEDTVTGHQIARQEVPYGSDFHCNLRFEKTGIIIDVVNNNKFTAENARKEIYKEGKWVVETYLKYIAAVGSVLGSVM